MARPFEEIEQRFIPPHPGSYVLHLTMPSAVDVRVGRLGSFAFAPGEYLYVGSAWGNGGLRSRLEHHISYTKGSHWHIDWLRRYALLSEGWFSTYASRLECHWSKKLAVLPSAFIPVPGFGASDCRSGCRAHLIGFPFGFPSELIEDQLAAVGSQVEIVRVVLVKT